MKLEFKDLYNIYICTHRHTHTYIYIYILYINIYIYIYIHIQKYKQQHIIELTPTRNKYTNF